MAPPLGQVTEETLAAIAKAQTDGHPRINRHLLLRPVSARLA